MDSIVLTLNDKITSQLGSITTVKYIKGKFNSTSLIRTNDFPRVSNVDISIFSDAEMSVMFNQSVRNKIVYIVGSTGTLKEEKLLQLTINAAKNANAAKVIAVITYFGYARQDKKSVNRGCIGAKVSANNLMSQGLDAAIIIELHSISIEGFFNIPIDNIYGDFILITALRDVMQSIVAKNIKRTTTLFTFLPPDHGGTERSLRYVRKFNKSPFTIRKAIAMKAREKPNQVSDMTIVSEYLIEGTHCVIVDDMVDTANTIIKAAVILKERGALSITAIFPHPVLSGDASEKIENSPIDILITTDSIDIPNDKIKVFQKTDLIIVSCGDSITRFIDSMDRGVSAIDQFKQV